MSICRFINSFSMVINLKKITKEKSSLIDLIIFPKFYINELMKVELFCNNTILEFAAFQIILPYFKLLKKI